MDNLHFQDNSILAALPRQERQALGDSFEAVALRQGARLHGPDSDVTHVFFPRKGLVSLITVTRSGHEVETGVIGRDGVVGAAAATGARRAVNQSVVQIAGEAWRIETGPFASAYDNLPVLRSLANSFQNFILLHAQQHAACHALHHVEGRLCRWLLKAQDTTGLEVLNLTQEFLATMLGVRRSSVSVVAHRLQKLGALRYRRGHIEIRDRDRLERRACECYGMLRSELGTAFAPLVGNERPQKQTQPNPDQAA